MGKFSYKVDSKPTMELIEKLNEDRNIYFRFHDPSIRMTYKSKSWGMIYSSEREALADGSEVLDGKSCMDTIEGLMSYIDSYDKDYVVMAFIGDYNGTGSDGECVCRYSGKVAVFDFEEFFDFYENVYKKNLYTRLKEDYNNTKPEFRRFRDWSMLQKLEYEFSLNF